MSIPDEYKDLENRLRQSKPQTEPLPPAFKRQVRHELMEQMTMNDNRFSFRKLSMALGGLILLIGIPVFFWLAQMSIGTANNPDAGLNPGEGLDPSRPTPTRVRNVVVAQGSDRVWLMSTDIPQGETIGRDDTIFVTVGYELVSVQEADLTIKLVEGPQALLAVSQTVSGTLGTATVPMPLAELEAPAGDLITLELNLLVDSPDEGVTKIVFQDFGAGWTVAADILEEQTGDRAWFVSSEPVEGGTAGVHNTINVTVGYELVTVEEAELLIKLVDGPVGLLTAGKIISGTNGVVVIPLSLADLEDGSEGNPLQLQLLLRDPTPGVTELLYLDFVEDWTMAAAELVEESRLPEASTQSTIHQDLPLNVVLGDAPRIGDPDAPIVIVEFTDYQCPFCSRHFQQTYPQIIEGYINSGIAQYVIKDFPLKSIHPQAAKAAEAARCAGDQEAYWEMHDILFNRQSEWGVSNPIPVFAAYAGELGLDSETFTECLETNKYQAAVDADLQQGIELGVTGTPAFFINGYPLSGAQPFEVFKQGVATLLISGN